MTITSPSPSPSPSPTRNLSPSADAAKAANTVPKTDDTTGTPGLTGVPKGTKVVVGVKPRRITKGRIVGTEPTFAETQYMAGDGMKAFATLSNQEKISLLAELAQIPGLYSRKTAPTQEYLLNLAKSRSVPVRSEDANALEDVMRYADTVGLNYKNAVSYLAQNPTVAQGFFDIAGTKAGKQREIQLTPADALATELEQNFLDYLEVKADKKEVKEYVNRINSLEKKRGGSLTSLERQQLLLDTVQEKAKQIYKDEAGVEDSLLYRKGALGGTFNVIKNTYNDYGVAVDDKTIYKQAVNSIRSRQALENTLNKIKIQAEVAMPAIKSYLQQGLTAREALGSYIGYYSKVMGVPENQVDLGKLAPVWSGDKVMPYTDWEKYVYTLPEIKKSPVFQQQQLNDARALIRNFIGQVTNGQEKEDYRTCKHI